jgi:FAD:protein FMN transferase
MATRFELVLYGNDPVRLRAADEEALREMETLEARLSFYRPDSEIRWINTHAAARAVKVEPRLFRLLQRCASLTALTDGAFDITIGPLMRAWRFVNDTGGIPSPAELDAARAVVGKESGQPIVSLRDGGLSVSAAHGKSFEAQGQRYGHVIDPRSAEPVSGAIAAAAIGPLPADGRCRIA